MNIKYLVKDGSGDLYVPIYPFHQETYELAGGGPGSGSLVNKKLRIAITVNIADESQTYTLLAYGYFLAFSEIEVLGERHTFPITEQSPFTWQFDRPGEYTFYVTLRPEVRSTGPVFYNIQNVITSISLSSGIETIPGGLFATMNMPNVDVIVPSSVKYIGKNGGQFGGSSLHKLVIHKDCIVDSTAFGGCAPEILEFHGTYIDAETVPFGLFNGYLGISPSRLKKLIIDCRNTQITRCQGMSMCEEIEVSGNVETILSGCFGGCSLVKKITLSGNKLKDIQSGVFGGCSSLKYIKLPNSLKVLKSGVFNGLGTSLETVVLPEGLEEIQSNAFAGISTLKNVNIPPTITVIPSGCFVATGLLNIDIPNSIITIGSGAFASCNNLKQVEIPNSVLRIESGAFSGAGLTEIIIPTSVKFIGSGAFAGCPATKVYIPNTLETVLGGAFALLASDSGNNTLMELYVDTNLVAGTNFSGSVSSINLLFPAIFGAVSYKALKRVELGPNVTRIGAYAFYYSSPSPYTGGEEREIIFGDNVKEIGAYAFAYSNLVNELDLSYVEHIGDNAFYLFDFENRDVILHNIKSIGRNAFMYATHINTLEISTEDKTLTESNIDINNYAFSQCGIYDKLIVDIPVKLETGNFLGTLVLQGGTFLHYKTLYLGDLVYNQASTSSSGSTTSPLYIENAYFGKNIEYIPNQLFDSRSNLKTVKLHAKKIGNRTFSGCSNLESAEGLDSVCYFGSGCFDGCSKLNLGHITIPSVLEGGYLGLYAFDYTKIISLTNNCESVDTRQSGVVGSCYDLVEVVNNATTGGTTVEILGHVRTQYNTSLKVVATNDKNIGHLENFPALETLSILNPEVTFESGGGSTFINCPKLKDVYIYKRIAPDITGGTFVQCAENVKVHVAANAIGYEAWVDGSIEYSQPYQLHWEIVKDLPALE